MTPPDISDGCSGFWLFEALFPIRDCCVVHDAGGTDGMLLDCLMAATPGWAWPLVGLCVLVMIVCRPLYRLIKPWLNPLVLKVRAIFGR